MAAFNYIKIKTECPVCKTDSDILCQIHVASDFDGDMNTNRFCHHIYEMGQKMPWFTSEEDKDLWYVCEEYLTEDGKVRENCYSTCESCKTELM